MNDLNKSWDNRAESRTQIKLTASCEQNGSITECDIIDISPQGIGIRVKCLLVPGDEVKIILGDNTLPARVVRSNGNMAGLWFHDLGDTQLNYVKWLCRKSGEVNAVSPETMKANYKTKVYVLKAVSEKDAGLLGLFIASLRKNCKGFVKAAPVQNGAFHVEIYDSPSSVSSFESLLMFWKAGNLIVK